MWNESATSASDPTAYPTMSSYELSADVSVGTTHQEEEVCVNDQEGDDPGFP